MGGILIKFDQVHPYSTSLTCQAERLVPDCLENPCRKYNFRGGKSLAHITLPISSISLLLVALSILSSELRILHMEKKSKHMPRCA